MPRSTIKTDIGVRNTIRSRLGPWQAATVTISSADLTADSEGKKLLKAGTLLGSATADSTILGTSAKAKPANDATTEGLLFYDVDATHGDIEASMLYMGTVGLDRIPAAPSTAALAALKRVTFTKD